MSIARNAVQLQASKIGQVVLAFVASIVLARTLGPRGAGTYAAVLAFAVLVQGVASLGFEDLVLARGPLYGGDTPRAHALYAASVRMRLVGVYLFTLTGAWVAALGIPDPFGSHSSITLACAFYYAGFNSFATLGATVQAARLRAGSAAALDFGWSLLVTAGYVALAATHRLTVERALVITAVAQLIVDVGYAAYLLPVVRHPRRRRRRLSDAFSARESALFWLNGLLSIGVGKTSDVLAMRLAGASTAATGIYNSAFNAFQTAAQSLMQGVGTISYVGLGRAFSLEDPEGTGAAWRLTVVVGVLASVPPLAVTLVFSRRIILLLYGPAFGNATSALVALSACGLAGRVLGGGSNQSILFLAERQATVLWVRGVVVTVNVVLDVVLFLQFGVVGVAAASGVSGVLIAAIELALARKIARLRVPVATSVKIFLPYFVAALAARAAVGQWHSGFVTIAAAAAAVLVGSGFLVLLRPLGSTDLPTGASSEGKIGVAMRRLARV